MGSVAFLPARRGVVKGDLRGIARARQLSEATVANMKQNLMSALVYNALGVPIAAGVLYPFTSVSVVANAVRLRGR